MSTECTRRDLLRRAGAGFGAAALASLLGRDALGQPHHPAKARAVIWLFMEGGPSGVDLFDPKPALDRGHGRTIAGIRPFFGDPGPLMKSPFAFRRWGASGLPISEPYAALGPHADDLALVRSCHVESNNHSPAMYQMNTGLPRMGFPSVGSWVTYGLGSENRSLPGFVVLGNRRGTKGGPANWGAGFLPTSRQGTLFRAEGPPALNLRPADDRQRRLLEALRALNQEHRAARAEPELDGRIESFELAYRMQSEALALSEDAPGDEERRLYGLDHDRTRPFGAKCRLARRLVERGVRFVQVYCDDEWDAHTNLKSNHEARCAETGAPIAGLLTDLKRRGLLESTLVVWGGEFGRMPVSEKGGGRDHNPDGFLAWMAGGGVRGGTSHGETDEIGHKAAVDPASVHDLHATMLHLLGLDHTKLTYFHDGRRYRLTDVSGRVLTKLL